MFYKLLLIFLILAISSSLVFADTVPPNNVTQIAVTQIGSALVASWISPTDDVTITANMRFNIYRSTTPNFSVSTNIISLTSNTSAVFTNDASVSLNYFLIKAVDEAGNESATSNVLFRIAKSFTYNSNSANIHVLSLPYVSPYQSASDLATMINGGLTPELVSTVIRYKVGQPSEYWAYFQSASAWAGTNFRITPGEAYGISLKNNCSFVLVGLSDQSVTLSFSFSLTRSNNYGLSIPYNSPIKTASDLVNEINRGPVPGTVTSVQYYGDDQFWHMWSYFGFFGWAGENFAVRPGEAYTIIISGNTVWKPVVIVP